MKRNRIAAIALTIGTAGACLASAAHADGTAARKLGQIGVINQTMQPKAPRSSPGAYSNSNAPTNNSTNAVNPGYQTNPGNAANANAATNARGGTAGRNTR
ncbi:hypothetical protein [Caballeronia sp. Lep1P3]|uniref:hypothetical protein n=1 Tax=Caballeronia sp. Lep1P3 TaxID=2878150 RepID=UPI001FD48333|nr:hypothetical protein [Caballeronia sp. Lep1P3]